MDIEVIECEQGSPEWHQARVGLITASMFSTVRDRLKSGPDKGDYKKAALDYAFRLAVERISDEPLDGGYQTYAMRRGHEMEPEARQMHSFMIGRPIQRAGIVRTTDRRFGASADGLIGDDGGSEYKCLIAPERLRTVLIDRDIDEFRDQVQGCLWLTGRKWWHFVPYTPSLKSVSKDVVYHTVRRDDDYIETMEHDLIAFDRVVEDYREKIQQVDVCIPESEAA